MANKSKPPEPGQPIKLNKTTIDAITEPGIYPDTELKGFKLWVSKNGTKSYQMVGKAKGKPQTIFCTIGKHGDPWTPDSARNEAERLRLLMRQGVNPNEQRKAAAHAEAAAKIVENAKYEVKKLTVGRAFEEFIITKKQKESTVKVYRWVVGKHLKDWLNKPLVDVNQDDILKRYDKIASESKSSASHAMRIFRAVFLTAQIKHGEQIPELIKLNPVRLLSHGRKKWNNLDPRDEFIQDSDLPAFYKAVMKLENTTARDYLLVCLLTGLRKNEACTLKWKENIDLNKKTITIHSEQAKNKQRHMLAMSDYLYDLFLKRWERRDNEYVFQGRSKFGNFSDPEKLIDKVIEAAEIEPFSSHSLRRTFATAADSLGYSLHDVQRLLNHKPTTVTDKHYIQNVVERTKEPMQRINDRLLELMKAKPSKQAETAKILPLTKTAKG